MEKLQSRKGKGGSYWAAFIVILCCLLAIAAAVIGDGLKPISVMRIAFAAEDAGAGAAIGGGSVAAEEAEEAGADTEVEAETNGSSEDTPPRTTLHGYEDTIWGVTAPDGSVVTDYTWEMFAANVRESAKNGIRVRINGIDVVFPDQAPVMENGRVLVPMRPVFEHVCVQCRVRWDGETGAATVFDQKGRQVRFKPGEHSYTVTNADGSRRDYPLDVPAAIINGRVLLPLRVLLETFSYKVDWYDNYQRVDIQDSFPGWRKLMKPEEWKKALEEECIPCSLIREVP